MTYPSPDFPSAQVAASPLQLGAFPVDSTRPTPTNQPARKQDPAPEPLPTDPDYFAYALIRHSDLLDKMGVPNDRREPFLRDLSVLAGIAMDAYFKDIGFNETDELLADQEKD